MKKREIKFRQWIGNTFHYWGFSTEYPDRYVGPAAQGDQNHKNTQHMQFTGLRDIVGNEIYEGEVLAGDGSGYYVVKWEHETGSWIADRKIRPCKLWMVDSPEVMGDIYQNPELLTV
jgi:hypothetical protein